MIKVYLKQPVYVERIDELGTGLIDKYEIYSLSGGMWHPHDEVGHSMLCSGYLEWGDWIATGADGSHWIIPNALYEQQYGELPVISKELDTYIQLYKRNGYGITDMLYDLNDEVCPDVHLTKDDIARAWLDGYQVEEDK
ncbi:hypothetical protein [Lactiplantibacillus plantarum]|uniref:hypothetical protein n=1 Tax=Lactiplantibacillus plantarum TaxID=1590 RepID=UPI0022405406|nr:hypothetical protein [Lactiplantibacillus plantarum]